MNIYQRRNKIFDCIFRDKETKIIELAAEVGVSRRTVQTDVNALKKKHPIETVGGNGGGVRIPASYIPLLHVLTQKEITALHRVMAILQTNYPTVVGRLEGVLSGYACDGLFAGAGAGAG